MGWGSTREPGASVRSDPELERVTKTGVTLINDLQRKGLTLEEVEGLVAPTESAEFRRKILVDLIKSLRTK